VIISARLSCRLPSGELKPLHLNNMDFWVELKKQHLCSLNSDCLYIAFAVLLPLRY
jgi:hypothetical protein